MVIGNGMMAKAFDEFANDDSIIVFASGVSNSKEVNLTAYHKELSMLSDLRGTTATLIYFSSCSIFDSSLVSSLYIDHKKMIEKYIESNFNSYYIFRLPNVIGRSNNSNTMVNFFYNSLLNDHIFQIYKNAFRYFIDVDDVKSVVSKIIKERTLCSGCYTLLFPIAYNVLQIVNLLETYLSIKGNYSINENEGAFYDISISNQLLPYVNFDVEEPEIYINKILAKYYPREISTY